MASIISEHNATGSWTVPDKIFGYLSSLTSDYTQIKYASLMPGQPGYVKLLPGQPGYEQQQALLAQNTFPWGAVVIIGGIGILGIIIYNAVKK